MIVVDTDVISEAMKHVPDPNVMKWFASHPAPELVITTLTQAEILAGVALLPVGKRSAALAARANLMFERYFPDKILSFDSAAAIAFALIAAKLRKLGRPIATFDAQIAAIAKSRGAAVATRNTRDFEHCDVPVVNPWTAKR
ncbi:MAG TPA: type II toxin-antitoxin system VapC family toxin [Bryobacteraceae bacterium]|nr:type II toxin-antitoxin system VapC family toxin [Bryobacteraceae bacterium]